MELDIIGGIGWFPNDKVSIVDFIKGNKDTDIVLNISSGGGDVDTALTVYAALRSHKGNVTVNLSGIVASAATIIAMGGNTINMSDTSLFLIHKVMNWIDLWGMMNEDEIEDAIEQLQKNQKENKKFDAVIANIYKKKTGKSEDVIMAQMKDDEFLTADEAKEFGFVDNIVDDEDLGLVNDSMLKMVASLEVSPELKSKLNSRIINQGKMAEEKTAIQILTDKVNSLLGGKEDKEKQAKIDADKEAAEKQANSESDAIAALTETVNALSNSRNEDLEKANAKAEELQAKLDKANSNPTTPKSGDDSDPSGASKNKAASWGDEMAKRITNHYS